jgi:hypothetical protein
MLPKNNDKELRMSYPKWLVAIFPLGLLTLFFTFCFYVTKFDMMNLSILAILKLVFLAIILIGGVVLFLRCLLYSVVASTRGLKANNIIGKEKSLQWSEIIEVRRPRFGLPQEIAYVISNKKERLLLLRSMKHYNQLIELIRKRAPNLQKCDP